MKQVMSTRPPHEDLKLAMDVVVDQDPKVVEIGSAPVAMDSLWGGW